MKLTHAFLALNNLRRNPVRALLAGLSLAVAAATLTIVLGLDRGYSRAVTEELVERTGVHMYVTKEGCPIEAASIIAQGGLSPLYVAEDLLPVILSLPWVDAALSFQLFTVTTEDGLRTDIFNGISDSAPEIKPGWEYERGGWFTSPDSVILGAEMGILERLETGEKFYSEQFGREFTVAGILKRNYSQDDGTIFLPLATAQEMVGREGKLSAIAIKMTDLERFDARRNELRAALPPEYYVIGSKELGEGILRFFASTRSIMFIMIIVAMLISVFSVINTMLMSILERRKEIACLKCVGAGGRDLFRLIAWETLFLCLAGSAGGTLLGLLLSPVFGAFMRRLLIAYVPSGPIAAPSPLIALFAFAATTLIGLSCAFYPAWKASRISPMEAMRNE